MTGISFVDLDFGAAVEKRLAHLAELGHRCIALFNFPPEQLAAGYNAAVIARDTFEEATADLGIRGIHLPCPHPPREAFAIAAGLLRTDPVARLRSRPAGSLPVCSSACGRPTCASLTISLSSR